MGTDHDFQFVCGKTFWFLIKTTFLKKYQLRYHLGPKTYQIQVLNEQIIELTHKIFKKKFNKTQKTTC